MKNHILSNDEIDRTRKHRMCTGCGVKFKPRLRRQRRCKTCSKAASPNQLKGRFVILERDAFCCIYCGSSPIEHGAVLHVDHVIPMDLGGKGIASNLVTSCEFCNDSKNNRLIDHRGRVLLEIERRNLFYGIDPNQIISGS